MLYSLCIVNGQRASFFPPCLAGERDSSLRLAFQTGSFTLENNSSCISVLAEEIFDEPKFGQKKRKRNWQSCVTADSTSLSKSTSRVEGVLDFKYTALTSINTVFQSLTVTPYDVHLDTIVDPESLTQIKSENWRVAPRSYFRWSESWVQRYKAANRYLNDVFRTKNGQSHSKKLLDSCQCLKTFCALSILYYGRETEEEAGNQDHEFCSHSFLGNHCCWMKNNCLLRNPTSHQEPTHTTSQ